MTTTINDIVTGALRNLNVIAAGEDPEAAVADEALTALNDMMLALPAKGVHSGWTELTLSADFPLEDRHIEGVKWMLAGKIAPRHGVILNPEQVRDMKSGWLALEADYKMLETLRCDDGLLNMPSQRLCW